MRVTDYELSHLILRFEQEKDMKVMHCVQNLGALRDLVDLKLEREQMQAVIARAIVMLRIHAVDDTGTIRPSAQRVIDDLTPLAGSYIHKRIIEALT